MSFKCYITDWPLVNAYQRDQRRLLLKESPVASQDRLRRVADVSRQHSVDANWYGGLLILCFKFALLVIVHGFSNWNGTLHRAIWSMLGELCLFQPSMAALFVWLCVVAEIYLLGTGIIFVALVFILALIISIFWVRRPELLTTWSIVIMHSIPLYLSVVIGYVCFLFWWNKGVPPRDATS